MSCLIRLICLGLFVSISSSSLALAAAIFYPGTFDPFHLTHLKEAQTALEQLPGASLTVLPVEQAYYNKAADNVERPELFPFPERMKLINLSFSSRKEVAVSPELRSIDQDVIGTLIKLLDKSPDPDRYLLIGTDVLEKWIALPGFQELLNHAQLLVGEDPRDPGQLARLKAMLSTEPRVRFFPVGTDAIRSADVNLGILAGSDRIRGMVAPEVFEYFNSHSEEVRKLAKDYIARERSYEAKLFQKEVIPYLISKGANANILKYVSGRDDLSALLVDLYRNGGSGEDKYQIIWDALPEKIKAVSRQSYSSDIIPALRSSEMDVLPSASQFQFGRRLHKEFKAGENRHLTKSPDVPFKFKVRGANENPELWILRGEGKWKKFANLVRIEGGKPYFHWNSHEMSEKWWRSGQVSAEEVNWRIANQTGVGNAVGGGYYVSGDSLDSAYFGNHLTVIEPEGELLLARRGTIDWNEIENLRVLNRSGISGVLMDSEATESTERVWINLVDPEKVTRVRRGKLEDLFRYGKVKTRVVPEALPLEYWLEKVKRGPGKKLTEIVPIEASLGEWLRSVEEGRAPDARVKSRVLEKLSRYLLDPISSEIYRKNPLIELLKKKFSKEIKGIFMKNTGVSRLKLLEFGVLPAGKCVGAELENLVRAM